MSVQVSAEGPDDAETIVVIWLSGMLPPGRVSNTRKGGDPVPALWVEFMDGNECIEEAYVNDVVAVNMLWPRRDGDAVAQRDAREGTEQVHRRMLELAYWLDDIPLGDGRLATIDYLDVFSRPRWEPYGDDQILRKVGRYRIGLSYAKLS